MLNPKSLINTSDSIDNHKEPVTYSIKDAQDAIAIVNNQLTMVASTIETSSSDAIVRFVKVISDIEGAIKSTNDIVDGVKNKLLIAVSKDADVNAERNVDSIRQQYESIVQEITKELSNISKRKVDDIVKMNEIRDQLKTTLQFSKKIEKISRGTKTLAINASIEAAQAGDYGKTFAVVAENIHSVAQLSQNSAVDIINQMNLMNQTIESNINLIEEAINRETRYIDSTIVIINDVFLSLVDSMFMLSHRIHDIVDTTLGESSDIKREVASIIVDLQFQDKTKQISEHIVNILEDVRFSLSKTNGDEGACDRDGVRSQVDLLNRFNNVATTNVEKHIAKTTLDVLKSPLPSPRLTIINTEQADTSASNDCDITFF